MVYRLLIELLALEEVVFLNLGVHSSHQRASRGGHYYQAVGCTVHRLHLGSFPFYLKKAVISSLGQNSKLTF